MNDFYDGFLNSFVRVSIIIWSESHWRRRNKCFDNNFKLCSARYVPSVLKAGRFLYTGSTSNQTSSSLGWASSNSVAKLKKKKKLVFLRIFIPPKEYYYLSQIWRGQGGGADVKYQSEVNILFSLKTGRTLVKGIVWLAKGSILVFFHRLRFRHTFFFAF